MTAKAQDRWTDIAAAKGLNPEILKSFDELGEGEVRRRQPTFGAEYAAHALVWIKAVDDERETRAAAARERELKALETTADETKGNYIFDSPIIPG